MRRKKCFLGNYFGIILILSATFWRRLLCLWLSARSCDFSSNGWSCFWIEDCICWPFSTFLSRNHRYSWLIEKSCRSSTWGKSGYRPYKPSQVIFKARYSLVISGRLNRCRARVCRIINLLWKRRHIRFDYWLHSWARCISHFTIPKIEPPRWRRGPWSRLDFYSRAAF